MEEGFVKSNFAADNSFLMYTNDIFSEYQRTILHSAVTFLNSKMFIM
jgi:hypothetical protein